MHCMASFFSYFASGGRKIASTEKSAAFARSGCAARTSASFSITHSRSRPHIGRDAPRADGLLHRVRHRDRGERIGGEVHCIQTVRRVVDRQAAAQHVKAHLCLSGIDQLHHGIGRRHGRVAAEINLTVQREPAQVPALAGFSQIGRLGEVVLPRDALEHFIAVGAVEHTDRRGIA